MTVFQQTLREPVVLEGPGLHTGRPIRVRIAPAPAGHGVRFVRVDRSPAVEIPALSRFVVDTQLATVLGVPGARISTVEHCLAALAGLGVTNARVEVDGPELPILDGSALPYVEAFQRAGLRRQGRLREVLRVRKPLRVSDGDKYCILRPGRAFRITYTIDFGGRFPGPQHFFLDLTPEAFCSELAAARTFGFLEEVEFLRRNGKALGGSMDNAIVLHEGRVLNPDGLRMPDELVRHKILDAVGDLALVGWPVQGHLIVHKGGHGLHDLLVKLLLSRPDAWTLEGPDVRPVPRPLPAAAPSLAAAHA